MPLKRALWILPIVGSIVLTSFFYSEVHSESENCKSDEDNLLVTYVSDESEKSDIYLVTAKGTTTINMTYEDGGRNINPAWSPNSVDMAFQSNRDGNWEIYFISNARETNLTKNPGDDTNPVWSPDGSRIAFVSNRDGNWKIYLYDFTDGKVTQLSTGLNDNFGPSWSPNGYHIAFVDSPIANQILLTDIMNGTTKTIVEMPEISDFEWSPNGTQMAFRSDADGDPDIYLLTVDTGEVVNLTNNTFGDDQPRWSPDGSKLLFWGDRGEKDQIFVMDRDGQNMKNLSSNDFNDRSASWSPTGLSIAFESTRETTDTEIINSLYRMSADGTNIIKLADHVVHFSNIWQPCKPK